MIEPPKPSMSGEETHASNKPFDDFFTPSTEWQEVPDWAVPIGGNYHHKLVEDKTWMYWDPPVPGPEIVFDKRTIQFQGAAPKTPEPSPELSTKQPKSQVSPGAEPMADKQSCCLGEFGTRYVIDRGISPEFAIAHGMDETGPDPGILNKRLGFGFGPEKLAQITSLVWLPVLNGDQNIYLARINGSLRDESGEILRFLYSKSSRRIPLIPAETLKAAKNSEPIILTEGFLKGLTLLHAGAFPIAFNGPWINEPMPENEKDKPNNRILARELFQFNFYGRSVYFAFDLDQATKRNVRHAVIRAWILLTIQGAKVFQLSWSGAKGVDDYIAVKAGIDREKQREVIDSMIASAKPFKEVLIRGAGGDAKFVRAELRNVRMDTTDQESLALEVSRTLGVTKASLLEGIDRERKRRDESNRRIIFLELEPWPEPVDGNWLLSELAELYKKHIHFSDDCAFACALWVIFTYLVQEPYIVVSPYLGFTAPDRRCAKTRALDLTERLVWRGFGASDVSQASFFRLCEKYKPTLLIDELHHLLARPTGLLGMLLNAYDRSKPVTRVNPENNNEVEAFDIFSAKAIAYLGILDPQLRDRVIEIRLERKPRAIKKAKLRETSREYTNELQRRILRWVRDNAAVIGEVKPVDLGGENDRASDNWEPLIAIASVIDPDNGADQVIGIARKIEGEAARAERESDEDAVLKAVMKVYRDVCDEQNLSYSDPKTDIFLSLVTFRTVLDKDTLAPWTNWKNRKEYGISERKIAQILRSFARVEPDRSREEPAHGLCSVSTGPARGYWLRNLRLTFEKYQ